MVAGRKKGWEKICSEGDLKGQGEKGGWIQATDSFLCSSGVTALGITPHNVLSIPLETGHSRRGKSDSHLYAGHVKTPHSSVDVKSIETANMGPSSGFPRHTMLTSRIRGRLLLAPSGTSGGGGGCWLGVPEPTSQRIPWKLLHVGLGSRAS